MRINKFLALHTSLSRRSADTAIEEGRVAINDQKPSSGATVGPSDKVTLDGHPVSTKIEKIVLILNKPAGYVCSRDGQGSLTVYDLLPREFHNLNSVGRLDKDSSGLLLMTNDGDLANQLTHPRYQKVKIYELSLDNPLQPLHHQMINDIGVMLDDGPSKLSLEKIDNNSRKWRVSMHEGRNRQIRRTFEALGYTVTELHRTNFGEYSLGEMAPGEIREV